MNIAEGISTANAISLSQAASQGIAMGAAGSIMDASSSEQSGIFDVVDATNLLNATNIEAAFVTEDVDSIQIEGIHASPSTFLPAPSAALTIYVAIPSYLSAPTTRMGLRVGVFSVAQVVNVVYAG